MFNTKDLTAAEFDVLWQMYCDYRYCQITTEQLNAYVSIGEALENEGKSRGIIDNWE